MLGGQGFKFREEAEAPDKRLSPTMTAMNGRRLSI
jgi:hypothetical protein